MNSHQIVDLIVLAVLLYCAVRGASRGLLSQLAWVVALLLCFKFSGSLAPAIEPLIGVEPPLKQWIAMLAVYVGLCGVSFVAAGMLSSWMEKAKIKDFDRHLGGMLGLVKGVIICMTIMYFVITKSTDMSHVVSKTYSGYAAAVILNNSQYLISLVPENRVKDVREVIDKFNQNLQPGADDLNGAKPADPGLFGADNALTDEDDLGFDLTKLLPSRDPNDGVPPPSGSDRPTAGKDGILQDVLKQLPAEVRRGLTEGTMDALRNSSAGEKQRLLEKLSDSVPEDSGSILNDFLRDSTEADGQGTGRSPGSAAPTQLSRTEMILLNEIAAFYSERSDVVPKAKQFLAGVPGQVQRRVLEDWHADAMGLDSDPDPSTDVNTTLDQRIVRQLRKSRISLKDLDRELRNRLSQAMP